MTIGIARMDELYRWEGQEHLNLMTQFLFSVNDFFQISFKGCLAIIMCGKSSSPALLNELARVLWEGTAEESGRIFSKFFNKEIAAFPQALVDVLEIMAS